MKIKSDLTKSFYFEGVLLRSHFLRFEVLPRRCFFFFFLSYSFLAFLFILTDELLDDEDDDSH